ncbi:MAG: 3-oxoacyl-[acyl-carrier-protein] reductase [Phycisphaeraceae bacterium]|nr:MAG: 3-oxoacyl-[acyl-carrier-protein] reductase [Phycisphaeraceae bacterium]
MVADAGAKRVALITGASRGIGRSVAMRLAQSGRHVVLAARTVEALEGVKQEIESHGGLASVQAMDLSDSGSLQAGVEKIAADHGRLDIVVNNAGITKDNLALRMSDEDFLEVLRVNLLGAFIICRAAARPMMRQKFGRIVNIGSTSGVIGNAGQANYAAAKAGLIGMTKSLARELGAKGITANVVAPGFIETDMTANLPQEVKDRVLEAMALRRLGTPEDIAEAVAYISSDAAGFLTGQVLCVDGGLTMC